MTYVRKYDRSKHAYNPPVELPKEWHTPLIADDMNQMINCAGCGKELKFGNSFTSMIICDMSGAFGFPVCEECYQKELAELFEEIDQKKRSAEPAEEEIEEEEEEDEEESWN